MALNSLLQQGVTEQIGGTAGGGGLHMYGAPCGLQPREAAFEEGEGCCRGEHRAGDAAAVGLGAHAVMCAAA